MTEEKDIGEVLLTTGEVLSKIKYGRTWLDERIAAGEFPAPKHKWRQNRWRKSVVDSWILKEFGDDPASQPTPAESHVSR